MLQGNFVFVNIQLKYRLHDLNRTGKVTWDHILKSNWLVNRFIWTALSNFISLSFRYDFCNLCVFQNSIKPPSHNIISIPPITQIIITNSEHGSITKWNPEVIYMNIIKYKRMPSFANWKCAKSSGSPWFCRWQPSQHVCTFSNCKHCQESKQKQ